MEEEVLRRYLLGMLLEPELTRVEQGAFTNEAVYQRLVLLEDEMIDAYVANRLAESHRIRFVEQYLLSPQRRSRVAFALTLRDSLAKSAPLRKESSFALWRMKSFIWKVSWGRAVWAGSAVAALLTILVIGGRFFVPWQTRQSKSPSEQARIQKTQPDHEVPKRTSNSSDTEAKEREQISQIKELQARLEKAQADKRQLEQWEKALPLSFVLTPGLLRDENGLKQLRLPVGERIVHLTLDLETQQLPHHRAILQTMEGVELWSKDFNAAVRGTSQHSVTVAIPGRLLRPDSYRLRLSSQGASGIWDEAGDYYFRVRND